MYEYKKGDKIDYNEFKQMMDFNERDRVIPSVKQLKEAVSGQSTMLAFQFTHNEVLNKDFQGFTKLMRNVSEIGKRLKQSLVVSVGGYDHVPDELYEIQEVREFVQLMFQKFPYLLYYLTGSTENRGILDHGWMLMCLSNDSTSVSTSEKMSGDEVWEKYGYDLDAMPTIISNFVLSNDQLEGLLKPVLKHGKIKKDNKGAKKVAIDYAMGFDGFLQTLNELNITQDDLNDYLGK